MLAPLVVFWLAAPAAPSEPHAEIAEWAAQRGFRPVTAADTPQPAYAEAVALEIEALLEDARTLAPGSGGTFQRLDELLVEHAELPQAGWWLAERYALEEQFLARGDERAVDTGDLGLRASAIEGARAAPVGAAVAPARASSASSAPLQLEGLRPLDELWVDGKRAVAGSALVPGRHHAQLFRAQRRVWASWVELGSPPRIEIPDPSPACSALDLWGTEPGARGPVAAPGVRCAAWAVARPSGSGIELALCRGARCEAWEHVEPHSGTGPSLQAAEASTNQRLPAWVTWGALGLGAAASTALVLWQTGAFDRPAPATEFVFTGPTAAALRF
jgi:hypothetical protein